MAGKPTTRMSSAGSATASIVTRWLPWKQYWLWSCTGLGAAVVQGSGLKRDQVAALEADLVVVLHRVRRGGGLGFRAEEGLRVALVCSVGPNVGRVRGGRGRWLGLRA
jgi:hypothetical protein